uniref:Transposase n=1 Tax=Rhabditophanes sp. KR3021 TaxID=114890 RepID=A0AC35U4R0_9BILA
MNESIDHAISAIHAEQASSLTSKYLDALVCSPCAKELYLETSKVACKRSQLSTDCNLKSLYCKKLKYYHWQRYGIVNRSINKKEKVPKDVRMTVKVYRRDNKKKPSLVSNPQII